MSRKLRLLSLLIVISLCFSFGGTTQASINTTISDWSASPIVLGPATWTYVSNLGLGPTTTPLVFTDSSIGGVDTNSLTVGDATHLLSPGVYDLKYSISLSPGTTFATASLGVDLTGFPAAATVTKYLSTTPGGTPIGTLISVNGQTASTMSVNGLSKLYVNELVSITEGSVVSITDQFTTKTSSVPEPASIMIWGTLGFGLMAFGTLRGRLAC